MHRNNRRSRHSDARAPVAKAARLAKMPLMDIGFDELVKKCEERKVRDSKDRKRIERARKKSAGKDNN
jgi:hypothetical protein